MKFRYATANYAREGWINAQQVVNAVGHWEPEDRPTWYHNKLWANLRFATRDGLTLDAVKSVWPTVEADLRALVDALEVPHA